jgi:hypothetical protein
MGSRVYGLGLGFRVVPVAAPAASGSALSHPG